MMPATLRDDSRTLTITRTLNAPRALVWKMFSDPYHLAQWWGPEGYTNRVEKLDFRTGGSWLHVMIGPDGRELPTDNIILEVTEPERIVYRNAPADPRLFGDNPPPAFTKTVTFEDLGGATDAALHVRHRSPSRSRHPARLLDRHQPELRQARSVPRDPVGPRVPLTAPSAPFRATAEPCPEGGIDATT